MKRLVLFTGNEEKSVTEMLHAFGLKDRKSFLKYTLTPAIAEGPGENEVSQFTTPSATKIFADRKRFGRLQFIQQQLLSPGMPKPHVRHSFLRFSFSR